MDTRLRRISFVLNDSHILIAQVVIHLRKDCHSLDRDSKRRSGATLAFTVSSLILVMGIIDQLASWLFLPFLHVRNTLHRITILHREHKQLVASHCRSNCLSAPQVNNHLQAFSWTTTSPASALVCVDRHILDARPLIDTIVVGHAVDAIHA